MATAKVGWKCEIENVARADSNAPTMAIDKIDYVFLSKLEGGSVTVGYVPAAAVSSSGVTIATGFDLGQRSESDLKILGIVPHLVAKFKPYMGKKRKAAEDALKKTPLTISVEEAAGIDKVVKKTHISLVRATYNSAIEGEAKRFLDLPGEAQTVIASVSFQYGVGLRVRTPKFWKAVTSQDWKKTVAILNDFGDAYSTRRRKEAALLSRLVQ